MFRESRRITAYQVLATYLRGGREFRSNDLARLDLSGADFCGTSPRGACLRECRRRPTRWWRAVRQIIGVLVVVLGGWCLMAFASLWFAASLLGTAIPSTYRVVVFLVVLGLLVVLTRRGFSVLAGAGAIAAAGPGPDAGASDVAVAIVGAFAGASAVAVAVTIAFAGAIGAPRGDFERVAEALHRKVWEQTQVEQSALVRLPEKLPQATLREGLSSLMGRRLERMELREAPPEPGPALLRWRWENPTEPGANRLLGPRPCRLFLLHAPDDHELAAELREHLQSLVRQQLVDHFSAEELLGGDDADELLSAHLESADAIVVLVSKSLLQEGPWYQQLTRAMARQHAKSARVIPVLVRPVACEGEAFARLHALPENAPPVVSWPDRDAAWACVVSGLRRVLLNQASGYALLAPARCPAAGHLVWLLLSR
jgi:TIR domain-containing protein